MGVGLVSQGPRFSSALQAPSPEMRRRANPEWRLYLLNSEQNESWGESLRDSNVERGIVSLILDVEAQGDTRMITANEEPEMKRLRSHFIERRLEQVSYTPEVEELTLTQDILRTAFLYSIPALQIRSTQQSAGYLQDLRNRGLLLPGGTR